MHKKEEVWFCIYFLKNYEKNCIVQKIFSKIFAYFKKKTLQILHHAKVFIIFLHTCLKKSKKISQIKKNFIEYFRILKKTEKGSSCTVNN